MSTVNPTPPAEADAKKDKAKPPVEGPRYLRQEWPDDLMHYQENGFIAVMLPETSGFAGAEPRKFGLNDDLITLYRGRYTAVPLRIASEIERRIKIDVVLEKNPIFDREFGSIEEVPNMIPDKMAVEHRTQLYHLTKRKPEPWEIGLALTRFPHDDEELAKLVPAAHKSYMDAWEKRSEDLAKERLTGRTGATRGGMNLNKRKQ